MARMENGSPASGDPFPLIPLWIYFMVSDVRELAPPEHAANESNARTHVVAMDCLVSVN